jgi:hypothetical protein
MTGRLRPEHISRIRELWRRVSRTGGTRQEEKLRILLGRTVGVSDLSLLTKGQADRVKKTLKERAKKQAQVYGRAGSILLHNLSARERAFFKETVVLLRKFSGNRGEVLGETLD